MMVGHGIFQIIDLLNVSVCVCERMTGSELWVWLVDEQGRRMEGWMDVVQESDVARPLHDDLRY